MVHVLHIYCKRALPVGSTDSWDSGMAGAAPGFAMIAAVKRTTVTLYTLSSPACPSPSPPFLLCPHSRLLLFTYSFFLPYLIPPGSLFQSLTNQYWFPSSWFLTSVAFFAVTDSTLILCPLPNTYSLGCHLLSLDILYNFGSSLPFHQFLVLVHQTSSHRYSSISSHLNSTLPSGLQVHSFFIYCSYLNESVPCSSIISLLDSYFYTTCQDSLCLFPSLLQFLDWLYPQTRSFLKTAVILALPLTSL